MFTTKSKNPALASRVKMYAMPYPDEKFRIKQKDLKWLTLKQKAKNKKKILGYSCEDKINEIVNLDILHFKRKKEQLGVRSLFQFLGNFEHYIDVKLSDKKVSSPVDCEDYDINESAKLFASEYQRDEDRSLAYFNLVNKLNSLIMEITDNTSLKEFEQEIEFAKDVKNKIIMNYAYEYLLKDYNKLISYITLMGGAQGAKNKTFEKEANREKIVRTLKPVLFDLFKGDQDM